MPVGVIPKVAKSFLTGAGVVLVESPETDVAAVDVPGVETPVTGSPDFPKLNANGFSVVAGVSFEVPSESPSLNPDPNPNEGLPADEDVTVAVGGSGGLGVVETLAGALEKPNCLDSVPAGFVVVEGVNKDDCFDVAEKPPNAGFASVGLSDGVDDCCGCGCCCPNPPKVGAGLSVEAVD